MFKCLIIDDEKPVIKAITAQLNWQQYHITELLTSHNGKEGLDLMRQNRPDIVFVDMQMPVMNGIEFLRLASKEFPQCKFIVISGYDEFDYAREAIKNGAIDYLLKPIIRIDLEQAVIKASQQLINTNRIIEEPLEQPTSDENLNADAVIEIIREYIENHYSADISIGMFSDKYFFSKEYLSKQFKKKYRVGIYEYLLKIRMEQAKALLQQSEISVKDIALRLGYSNNNYFSKAFKNTFHISPTKYRDRWLKDQQ